MYGHRLEDDVSRRMVSRVVFVYSQTSLSFLVVPREVHRFDLIRKRLSFQSSLELPVLFLHVRSVQRGDQDANFEVLDTLSREREISGGLLII